MVTTRLMPLYTGKGCTVGQAISDILDYSKSSQKTNNGRLITIWQYDSRIADAECRQTYENMKELLTAKVSIDCIDKLTSIIKKMQPTLIKR